MLILNRFPNGVYVEGMNAAASATPVEETEDDFFDSWSKPNTPKSSNPGTPRISTPPVIGRTPSTASTAASSAVGSTSSTTGAGTANTTVAPTPARTISHSSAARPARLGAGTSRLGSAGSAGSGTAAAKKSKLGLGASKAKPVDFAEAERKALEEAERIKQLGYDREREAAEEKARQEAEALRRAQEIGSRATTTSTSAVTTSSGKPAAAAPQKSAAFPRLGFGAIPGAGAAAAVAAANAPKPRTPVVDDAPTTAREKFGNQKGISSDMYFERNAYDANNAREAQTRLQNFQGATSISSNQYFGRDEEDQQLERELADGSLLGDGSLANLEIAAKDAIQRVLANPDVQQVGESIRSGALKVCFLPKLCHRDRNGIDHVNSSPITWHLYRNARSYAFKLPSSTILQLALFLGPFIVPFLFTEMIAVYKF